METTMSNIPEDILSEVLARLPVKTIGTCSVVCKSWNRVIKSSTFIHGHNRRRCNNPNPKDNVQLFLVHASEKVKINHQTRHSWALHWDNDALDEHAQLMNPMEAYYNKTRHYLLNTNVKVGIIGTCNGLVCLTAGDTAGTKFIWNPCIRKFVFLPRSSGTSIRKCYLRKARYAFGYDSRTDDYKVLKIVSSLLLGCNKSCQVEIWSLSTGCWKSLDPAVIPADFWLGNSILDDPPVFVNGALHWIQTRWDKRETVFFIASFDMSSELFGEISLSEDMRRGNSYRCEYLSRYQESLTLILENIRDFRYGDVQNLDIWVMREYGVAESWTKLSSVCLRGYVRRPPVFRKNGELVQHCWGRPTLVEFMDYFVESLVLLDH